MGLTDFHILWSSCQRGTTVIGAVRPGGEEAYSSPRRLALLDAMAVYRPFRVTLPSSVALLTRQLGQFLKGNGVGCSALDAGSRGSRVGAAGKPRRLTQCSTGALAAAGRAANNSRNP